MALFDDQISFEYCDIFAEYDKVRERPEVVTFLSKQPPLPVVAFDGAPKFYGGVSVKAIAEALRSMGLTANPEISGV